MFKRWFKALRLAHRAVTVPLAARMDVVPEWSNDDAEALRTFWRSPAGSRLRARLWDGVVVGALDALNRRSFERGEVHGMARTLEMIETHTEQRNSVGGSWGE